MEAGANASSPVVGCRLHAESAAAHTTAAQKRRMDQTSRPYQACLGGSRRHQKCHGRTSWAAGQAAKSHRAPESPARPEIFSVLVLFTAAFRRR
jgi:hypothetical protein